MGCVRLAPELVRGGIALGDAKLSGGIVGLFLFNCSGLDEEALLDMPPSRY